MGFASANRLSLLGARFFLLAVTVAAAHADQRSSPANYGSGQILSKLADPQYQGPDAGYEVMGFNNRGQAVGNAIFYPITAAVPKQMAALLWQNGRVTKLEGLPGYTNSYAEWINDRGQIVGFVSTLALTDRAVLWQHGRIRDLGTLPGGHSSRAYSINSRGQIVGTSDGVACLWTKGRISKLPGIEGTVINDRGQILANTRQGAGYLLLTPSH
ncbi:MAG: hypothetical protein M3Y28_00010 [Armatimonadota bacterium]|nr:hypothetical protein [Armatimonadota bacterium]